MFLNDLVLVCKNIKSRHERIITICSASRKSILFCFLLLVLNSMIAWEQFSNFPKASKYSDEIHKTETPSS